MTCPECIERNRNPEPARKSSGKQIENCPACGGSGFQNDDDMPIPSERWEGHLVVDSDE